MPALRCAALHCCFPLSVYRRMAVAGCVALASRLRSVTAKRLRPMPSTWWAGSSFSTTLRGYTSCLHWHGMCDLYRHTCSACNFLCTRLCRCASRRRSELGCSKTHSLSAQPQAPPPSPRARVCKTESTTDLYCHSCEIYVRYQTN